MNSIIKISAMVIISLLAIVLTFSIIPAIEQDLNYHNFADDRVLFGIPNFCDVIGNLSFVLFGIMGLYYLRSSNRSSHFTMQGERALWIIFFSSAVLVGLGSGYYHLNPNNATLVWDRLPMTIAFMSFFSLIIMEYIDAKAGLILCFLLLLIGGASVFYWSYSESIGQGDLRPYALVQFLPILLIPLMLWIFPSRYKGLRYLGYTLGWYIFSKLLEYFDDKIFIILNKLISGHTLKTSRCFYGGIWYARVLEKT